MSTPDLVKRTVNLPNDLNMLINVAAAMRGVRPNQLIREILEESPELQRVSVERRDPETGESLGFVF